MNAHIFAFFIPQLPKQELYNITHEETVHRLVQVLRLKIGERIILFDGQHHCDAHILTSGKKSVQIQIVTRSITRAPEPKLVWLLPLLEREQWEEALYFLAITGAHTIVPLILQKTKTHRFQEKDRERAQRILVAACEQSKQFHIPEIAPVMPLTQAVVHYSASLKLVADEMGTKLFTILAQHQQASSLVMTSGPEGGFTADEMLFLTKNGFLACSLTPSILKACHAVLVAAGSIRSWYR